jgi:hypothetical protein
LDDISIGELAEELGAGAATVLVSLRASDFDAHHFRG